MIIYLMKAPHCGVAVDAVPEVGLGGVTRLVREEMGARTLEPNARHVNVTTMSCECHDVMSELLT